MINHADDDLWKTCDCPLCGSNEPRFLAYDWQPVGGQRYNFNLVRCPACGLVYVNPRLNFEALTAVVGGGAWHEALAANRSIYEAGCRRLIELLPGSGSGKPALLDVGCAYGDFMTVAAEHGFQATGVEVDRPVAEVAQQSGLVVHVGFLEELSLPAHSFDAVTLWDVIEHVEAPRSLLAEVTRLLKPHGILLVHTGNAAFQVSKGRLLAALRPGRGPYNAPAYHLCHYSTATMRLLLRQAGTYDQLEFTHLDTVHYRRRAKYVAMKAYNETTRALNRVGLPLWTSSLAVLARKANRQEA
jgi:2-polyprenyl-3-methyl-5-hydroxy-6-metoxy-1,4-benzoquinol methylase